MNQQPNHYAGYQPYQYPSNPYQQQQQAPAPYPSTVQYSVSGPQEASYQFAPLPQTSTSQQQAPRQATVQQPVQQQAVQQPLPQQHKQLQTPASAPRQRKTPVSRQKKTPAARSSAPAPATGAFRQHASSPPPPDPPTGPGAPPPQPDSPEEEPNSPTMSQYEEDLVSRFRQNEDNNEGNELDEDGQPIFHLPPPPEGTYPSDTELEKAIHAWSLEHGYELVRRASKKNAKGILYKRYYHCSKHGKIANTGKLTDNTRVRINRKSNRTDCPMSLAAVAVDPSNPDGEWQIRHRKTHHNHAPLEALALAGHRRRARMGGVEKAVDGLFAIGTPTAQVLTFLQRTNPNGLFTRTDVANMKLKFKKYGTCVDNKEKGDHDERRPGFPSACIRCRTRKTKCDSMRPSCTNCLREGHDCAYDFEPEQNPYLMERQHNGTLSHPIATQGQAAQQEDDTPSGRQKNRSYPSQFQQNASTAQEILANLAAMPTSTTNLRNTVRLDLNHSSVEVLASSSCGNGDSYKAVPKLTLASDWRTYSDAMLEASLKENTNDVLTGVKVQPRQPENAQGKDEPNVEEWNEYVKQLAIFNRRNAQLTGALLATLAPNFRNRVSHLRKAAEIWMVLEELCLPRGSDQAFRLYLELHTITLQNSSDLRDYIARLENSYNAFNRLSYNWRDHSDPSTRRFGPTNPFDPNKPNSSSNSNSIGPSSAAARGTAGDPWTSLGTVFPSSRLGAPASVMTEEILCFLFLKNLGPDYRRWVEGLCGTSNVGGFGTGPKLGFADLTKRAVEWQKGREKSREGAAMDTS